MIGADRVLGLERIAVERPEEVPRRFVGGCVSWDRQVRESMMHFAAITCIEGSGGRSAMTVRHVGGGQAAVEGRHADMQTSSGGARRGEVCYAIARH
jgi:hypothetical protein